jgi:hypothetical protein
MKKDELIDMWQKGSDRMFRDEKTDKKMIAQYVNEKTLKGSRNIYFNLIFYGLVQLANIILLSMNLAGYANNPALIWILIPQLAISIGILLFGVDLFYKLKNINNYSESLQVLIEKQLWFFKRPYEIWLFLASVSAIILAGNVNLYIDNDNGSYVINNKLMFVTVTLAAFLFIYGAQKVASIRGYKALKAYLHDLQQGALEKSEELEHTKKRYLWLWIIVFAVLSVALIFGIISAAQF